MTKKDELFIKTLEEINTKISEIDVKVSKMVAYHQNGLKTIRSVFKKTLQENWG